MQTKSQYQIRWMIRRDLPEVMQFDNHAYAAEWSEEEYLTHLRQRNCIALVALRGEKIAGYVLYFLKPTTLEVVRLSETEGCSGSRVALLDRLVSKLSHERRSLLRGVVHELDRESIAAWRAVGGIGSLSRGEFGEFDGIEMSVAVAAKPAEKWSVSNRVGGYLD